MPKFRKKPIVIEAWKFEPGTGKPWPPGVRHPNADGPYVISTLEGEMIVSPGDWVIAGVQRELYPCNPYIFEASYEPAV